MNWLKLTAKTTVKEYQLASAVHALQRNDTQQKHCPPNYWKEEYPSLAYEFKASPQGQKSIYVQKTLMIRNIHGRSIWRWQILQPLKFNFEKRGHRQLSPDFGNKVMELSPVTIKQEHIWMPNQHQHEKKHGRKGSNCIKTSSPDF